jgi:phosphotriesterase-related protein
VSNERIKSEMLKGMVQTVCGLVTPEQIGWTLLHEHVLVDIRAPSWKELEQVGETITLANRFAIDYGEVMAPGNYVLNNEHIAISELKAMRRDGGDTLVDLSCGGLHPDPLGLKRVSEASGTHIVMGCGYYVDEYQDASNRLRSVDDFASEMVNQIELGAWGTDVRAGIIGEIGCQAPWTAFEKRVMKAAVIAQMETGASLCVHPGRDPDQPQEISGFLRENGADLSRSVISHIDRTIFDDGRLFQLADTGVVIELDLFGMESSYYKLNEAVDMPNDALRLRTLRRLIDRGHLNQIAISHDICFQTRLGCNGGHGYGHIFRNVMPMMKRRGFSDDEINTILRETPRRLLTIH